MTFEKRTSTAMDPARALHALYEYAMNQRMMWHRSEQQYQDHNLRLHAGHLSESWGTIAGHIRDFAAKEGVDVDG